MAKTNSSINSQPQPKRVLQLILEDKDAILLHTLYNIGALLVNGQFAQAIELAGESNEMLGIVYTPEEKKRLARAMSRLGDSLPTELLEELGFRVEEIPNQAELIGYKPSPPKPPEGQRE